MKKFKKIDHLSLLGSIKELLLMPKVFVCLICFMSLIILAGTTNSAFAQQQKKITGKITDNSGLALPGVTVLIKGTTQGVVTNNEGDYSITNIPDDAVLVYSFVGMITQEVIVGNQIVIDISMGIDAIGIEEVVAIGYGTARKSDLTGSVNRVNIEELRELPNVSVMQSVQGTVPGLNVGAVDQAGEDPTISIRGQNTLSSAAGANSPLIVVDGSIFRGNLVDLNPSDIQSVDILKDASSASIYGSQASNGVLIITTKKGNVISKPIVGYSGSYTLQIPSNKIEPMRREEYLEFFPDVFWERGSRLAPDYIQPNPEFSFVPFLKTNELARGYQEGIDTDWYGPFTGNGSINSHDLSIRGKGDKIGYYVSGGYTDNKGFLKNDDYKRFSYRMNIDAEINKWLNLGIESFLTSSDYSGVPADLANIFNLQPFAPVYDVNGEYVIAPEGSWLNPYLQLEKEDSDKRLNLFANIHAEIKLPVKGLSYKAIFGQNYRTTNQDRFDPWGATYQGSGYKNSSINYDWTFDNIVTFIRTFNEVHNLNATFVYGVEKREYSYTNTGAQIFTDKTLGYNRLDLGDPTLRSLATGAQEEQSLYTMLRALYNYNNKYLITGTVRRDGFSGFGSQNKIGVFPSVALGWVATEESFIKDNINWLNYLKLRGSYGSVGRRGVGRYDTKAVVSAATNYVYGDGGTPAMGQWQSRMANDELGWETTTGINLGIDFNFFNSKLFGNMEYYKNNTKDILYAIQIPVMTGFSTINTNIGQVANHGLEFTLNSQIIKNANFTWDAGVVFSRNRNEIVSILGADNDGDGKEDDLVANQLFIGHPTDVIYDYEIIGMWQLADKTAGVIPNGFFPGTYKIADLSGPDGEPDGKFSANDDKRILGYRDPSYRIGISNTLNYKQFRLYVFVNSIQGGKDYYWQVDIPYVDKYDQLTYQNVPKGTWDYWMPERPDAYFRRLDVPASYAAERYAQRNFIRIQDLSLSYTFDKNMLSTYNISNLRVFVSGKNLATFTKWRGWDPETGIGFQNGIPVMTSYSLGINVEF